MGTDRKTITISSQLYDLISARVKSPVTGFESVEEYVDYVLKEILLENEDKPEEINEEETKRIQEELKKLGYI